MTGFSSSSACLCEPPEPHMHTDSRSGDVCILLCLHSLDKHFIKAINWGEGATGKSLSGLRVSLDDINIALKHYNMDIHPHSNINFQ